MTSTSFDQSSRPAQRRILFVEDHQDVRRVVSLLLEYEGHVVDTAENGARALELFHRAPEAYDVLVTDHDMPQMDGLELVEKLRQAKFRGKLIVVSGGLTPANTTAYLDLEVDHILGKPISCEVLSKIIERTREANPVRQDIHYGLRDKRAA